MSKLPLHLLSDTATELAEGSVAIGGVPLLELASRYGTPVFVYDEQHLRNEPDEVVASEALVDGDHLLHLATLNAKHELVLAA